MLEHFVVEQLSGTGLVRQSERGRREKGERRGEKERGRLKATEIVVVKYGRSV
jgi:hypothetical protein